MCLHAVETGSEAFFTHPAYYHPEYSTGIKMNGIVPAGYPVNIDYEIRGVAQSCKVNPVGGFNEH